MTVDNAPTTDVNPSTIQKNAPKIPNKWKETVNQPATIPYPSRLKDEILDAEFQKFAEMLQQIFVNINLMDAVTKIPSFRKFLKDLLNGKRIPKT